jgi:hypothetical protein
MARIAENRSLEMIDTDTWAMEKRFFDGPAWRWRQAQSLAAFGPRRLQQIADQMLRDATRYVRGLPGNEKEFPLISAAERLANDGGTGHKLKILVLAKCSAAEIATRLDIREEVIHVWESVFFDVRDALPAIDWILAKVIQPAQEGGLRELASKMKFAYVAGPVAATAILDCEARPLCALAERIFDRTLRLSIKFDAVTAIPLRTSQEALRFMVLASKLRLSEKHLELAKRRLEHKCQEASRRYEIDRCRLQHSLARDDERKQAQARRAQEKAAEREAEARLHEHSLARQRQEALARAATSRLADLRWGSTAERCADECAVGLAGTTAEAVMSLPKPEHVGRVFIDVA